MKANVEAHSSRLSRVARRIDARLAKCALALAVLVAVSGTLMAQQPLRMHLLPELPGGGASRALSLSNGDPYGAGIPPLKNRLIGGEARSADGRWVAVVWERPRPRAAWVVRRLPDLNSEGSRVLDLTIVGNPTGTNAATGSSYIDIDHPTANVWTREAGEPWQITALPLLGGQSGESFVLTWDEDGTILCAGWSSDASGIRLPVLWRGDVSGNWTIEALPALDASGDSQVLALADLAELLGGYSYDGTGSKRPVVWDLSQGQAVVKELPLPIEARGGEVRAVEGDFASGTYRDTDGNSHAALWALDGTTEVWDVVELGTAQGQIGARGRGMIITGSCCRYGLVVGTGVAQGNAQEMTAWRFDGDLDIVPRRIQDSVVNARGLVLETATAVARGGRGRAAGSIGIIGFGHRPSSPDDPHAVYLRPITSDLDQRNQGLPTRQ